MPRCLLTTRRGAYGLLAGRVPTGFVLAFLGVGFVAGAWPDAVSAQVVVPVEGNPSSPRPEAIVERVTWTISGGLKSYDAFPEGNLSRVFTWRTPSMLVGRLPQPYDERGVRRDWKSVFLLHGAITLDLPGGPTEWLVRAPGLTRLSIDGKSILATKPHAKASSAHNHVPPIPSPEVGVRDARLGDYDVRTTIELSAGSHEIRLESVVGRPGQRFEPGETTVAFRQPGGTWQIVTGTAEPPLALTDHAVTAALLAQDADMVAFNAASRHRLDQDGAAWQARHDWARERIASRPDVTVPDVEGLTHPVDRFLAVKWQAGSAPTDGETVSGDELARSAMAILNSRCLRCHNEKARGDLRLDVREAALTGGESGDPAIVPGKASESLLVQLVGPDSYQPMPPTGEALTTAEIDTLTRWIDAGAAWPIAAKPATKSASSKSASTKPAAVAKTADQPSPFAEGFGNPQPRLDDLAFARRASLDLCGVVPTTSLLEQYLAQPEPTRRTWLIDRLLDDPRYADHQTAYWQDVLAENPSLLKPTLSNTGPFRHHIHEAMEDNRPLDRFVAELASMEGATWTGGPGGFAVATENDVPMAAKAHVLAAAFLGVDLKCARCHDSPYHSSTQRDLFEFAAFLNEKPITLPKSSSVPPDALARAGGKIKSTLKPGQVIEPSWPFASLAPTGALAHGGESTPATEPTQTVSTLPGSTQTVSTGTALTEPPLPGKARLRREAIQKLLDPTSSRFAEVTVNRLWAQLMGAGLIEPIADWEGAEASHPELLSYLERELVRSGYDAKAILRLIATSDAYSRAAVEQPGSTAAERLFHGPVRRMMTAEQIVDSLHAIIDRPMAVEELTFDLDCREQGKNFINLGRPTRAYEMVSLSNERDRPALALPRAQTVVDVMEAFGWRSSRAEPVTRCQAEPNIVMPATLGGGTLARCLTTVTDDAGLMTMIRDAKSPEALAESLVQTVLTRQPTDTERAALAELFAPGFASRLASVAPTSPTRTSDGETVRLARRVTWSNHLSPEANEYRLADTEIVAAGPVPADGLDADWRERFEDGLWTLVNVPEFLFVP